MCVRQTDSDRETETKIKDLESWVDTASINFMQEGQPVSHGGSVIF